MNDPSMSFLSFAPKANLSATASCAMLRELLAYIRTPKTKIVPRHSSHAIFISRLRLKEFEEPSMKQGDNRRKDSKPNCERKLKLPGLDILERVGIISDSTDCLAECNGSSKIEGEVLCSAREFDGFVLLLG